MTIYSNTERCDFHVVEYEDRDFPILLKEDYIRGRIKKLYYRGDLSVLKAQSFITYFL